MSQTTQFIEIPFMEGETSAQIASTVWGVGGAKVEDGRIKFQAGPDHIGARYIRRRVIVQSANKVVPPSFKSAGVVTQGKKKLKVLVEFPNQG